MSMYNMLFGRNTYSQILLAVLGYTESDCGRFRDCFPSADGKEIHVFTRNGGGNRESYQETIDKLATHPCYLRDWDDDFDCTYATIAFRVPEGAAEIVAKIADETDTTPPMERFQNLISDMEAKKDTAAVSRALDVGKKLFAAIESKQSQTVSTPEGSIHVITNTPKANE